MKTLFLKSATAPLIISLVDINYNELICVDTINENELLAGQPSKSLFLAITMLLERNKLDFGDINRLYIASGPGSYTGTRLLVTIVKTIWSLLPQIEIYDTSILAILERMSQEITETNYLSIVYARKNKYYVNGKLPNGQLVVDSVKDTRAVEILLEQMTIVNGQSETKTIAEYLQVPLQYDAWYAVSKRINDIDLYEPYYLEGVTIG